MPIRPRRQRRSRIEWSPRIALALTIGPQPGSPMADAVLREAWEAVRPYLLADYPPNRRPWGWWAFESSVPADLRGERPALYPVGEGVRVQADRDDLERRRAEWLAAAQTIPNPIHEE